MDILKSADWSGSGVDVWTAMDGGREKQQPSKALGCFFIALGGLFALMFGFMTLAGLTGRFHFPPLNLTAVFLIFTLMGLYLCCRGFRRFFPIFS